MSHQSAVRAHLLRGAPFCGNDYSMTI